MLKTRLLWDYVTSNCPRNTIDGFPTENSFPQQAAKTSGMPAKLPILPVISQAVPLTTSQALPSRQSQAQFTKAYVIVYLWCTCPRACNSHLSKLKILRSPNNTSTSKRLVFGRIFDQKAFSAGSYAMLPAKLLK